MHGGGEMSLLLLYRPRASGSGGVQFDPSGPWERKITAQILKRKKKRHPEPELPPVVDVGIQEDPPPGEPLLEFEFTMEDALTLAKRIAERQQRERAEEADWDWHLEQLMYFLARL